MIIWKKKEKKSNKILTFMQLTVAERIVHLKYFQSTAGTFRVDLQPF